MSPAIAPTITSERSCYASPIRSVAAALALLAALPACENSCFVANTLVATPKGPRRIADLAIGDTIHSVTPDGELVAREVTAIRRSLAATICRLTLGAEAPEPGIAVFDLTVSGPGSGGT